MLATSTFLRPKRSINHPPSSPKTPPHKAVIQSMRPTHSVTRGLLGGTCSISDSAGPAISGNISNSYVSNAKPITATRIISQPVSPNFWLVADSDETTGEFIAEIYDIEQPTCTRPFPSRTPLLRSSLEQGYSGANERSDQVQQG